MRNYKLLIAILFCISCQISNAQLEKYKYAHEIEGAKEGWVTLSLPSEIYQHVDENLKDIRVIAVDTEGNEEEAPYLMKSNSRKKNRKKISSKVFNKSKNAIGYFFSIEVIDQRNINEININLENDNFDWKVRLEGSNDNTSWFQIGDDQRIIGFVNEDNKYRYTKLKFDDSNYKYFRILIRTQEEVKLISAYPYEIEPDLGLYHSFPIDIHRSQNSKNPNTTTILARLNQPSLLSEIDIDVADNIDYYRRIVISYMTDSVDVNGQWQYRYRNLNRGTLSSLETRPFMFSERLVQDIKIVIHHNDNQPLTIKKIIGRAPVKDLVVRLPDAYKYFLAYGNSEVSSPSYDIKYFKSELPDTIPNVTISDPIVNAKYAEPNMQSEPLFQDKKWLWGVMVGIILLLGWATLKMMKDSEK